MRMRHFELLEDLRPFGTARAALLHWNGQHYVRDREEIELFEFIGTHGLQRDRGYALYSADSSHWEVVGGLQEPVEQWLPY